MSISSSPLPVSPSPPSPPSNRIVIIGGGVIGLTCALHLSRVFSSDFSITVVSKSFPSHSSSIDPSDPYYCSTKAGAHWYSFADNGDERQKHMDLLTYKILMAMSAEFNYEESGIYRIRSNAMFPSPSENSSPPWFYKSVDSFRVVSPTHFTFETPMVHMGKYLIFLFNQCKAKGITFIERELSNIHSDLSDLSPFLRVNCSGLGSLHLIGDRRMIPTRGRTVIVKNTEINEIWRFKKGKGYEKEPVYVLPRGDGTVILGGTYDDGEWGMAVGEEGDAKDKMTEKRILSDCSKICPSLSDPLKTEILCHSVGLRPTRIPEEGKGGGNSTRIERDGEDKTLIHCYGHSGWGMQSSWGSALLVENLISQCMGKSINQREIQHFLPSETTGAPKKLPFPLHSKL